MNFCRHGTGPCASNVLNQILKTHCYERRCCCVCFQATEHVRCGNELPVCLVHCVRALSSCERQLPVIVSCFRKHSGRSPLAHWTPGRDVAAIESVCFVSTRLLPKLNPCLTKVKRRSERLKKKIRQNIPEISYYSQNTPFKWLLPYAAQLSWRLPTESDLLFGNVRLLLHRSCVAWSIPESVRSRELCQNVLGVGLKPVAAQMRAADSADVVYPVCFPVSACWRGNGHHLTTQCLCLHVWYWGVCTHGLFVSISVIPFG
jgi:hypothetical protein